MPPTTALLLVLVVAGEHRYRRNLWEAVPASAKATAARNGGGSSWPIPIHLRPALDRTVQRWLLRTVQTMTMRLWT